MAVVAEATGAAGDGYPLARVSGCWLSRLERCVHIAEVAGSNPAQPTEELRSSAVVSRRCRKLGDPADSVSKCPRGDGSVMTGRRVAGTIHTWRKLLR